MNRNSIEVSQQSNKFEKLITMGEDNQNPQRAGRPFASAKP